ncbi:hypothetical protein [Hymenobacter fodinae]|uniref:Uncharacterized protein n=1 Tax=Hymenobacter fodinae TaxID=2510796 RepID=A0A4Z0P2U2_9BACT|nr:hypothetical protein [Hymenobacter fodinae]TGE05571.1 hypothetical protein EU556_19925 [Hymenobacter fodinae]
MESWLVCAVSGAQTSTSLRVKPVAVFASKEEAQAYITPKNEALEIAWQHYKQAYQEWSHLADAEAAKTPTKYRWDIPKKIWEELKAKAPTEPEDDEYTITALGEYMELPW